MVLNYGYKNGFNESDPDLISEQVGRVGIFGRFSMTVGCLEFHIATKVGFQESWKAILGLESLKMTPNVKITTIFFETNRFRFQSGLNKNQPIRNQTSKPSLDIPI